ncbi:HET-domain-containing protein [Paraphaeosphaeria sporulosa]|uniref:HET-domain-containing protein n=1 Tax=Paraphaeosphaeria sporulosa TaxID=1460663 RepID=A0A177CLF7_9PLEO|nr:HET-domain-containing protein [Paraphaeosphaeria sporulosa]OAG08071.1 HET-domain-containing protein [Paraphaeosphaeria sporulosa]
MPSSHMCSVAVSSGNEELETSSLCNKCESIFHFEYIGWRKDDMRPHHITMNTLEQSANSDCYICTRLLKSVSGCRKINIQFAGIKSRQWVFEFIVVFCIQYWEAPSDEYEWSPMRVIETEFCCLSLDRARQLSMQRSLQVGTRSHNTMRQARNWIDQCMRKHERCTVFEEQSWIPSRLVNVERISKSTMVAKLCTRGTIAPGTSYLSLSHRWGKGDFLTLKSQSLESWKKRIPIDELSRVFQDAIHVTDALGFAYIWIDSLCIIQDDLNDWKRESMTMHRIYKGAACNLAAAESESGEEGFVNTQRPSNPMFPIVRTLWLDRPQRMGYLIAGRPFEHRHEGPLFTRAWVLQEQILAARTLNFGGESVSWECNELVADEMWPLGFPLEEGRPNTYNPVERRSIDVGVSQIKLRELSTKPLTVKQHVIHHAWKCIIVDYMRRDISKPSDRLPALAGLANAFQSILPTDRYRFGAWMNDPMSLLWSPRHQEFQEYELANEVPSWSFARYETEIYWRYGKEEARDRTNYMLAQCLDAPACDAFPSQLHIQGPLMLPRRIPPEYSNEFKFSVELRAGGACAFTYHMDTRFLRSVKSEIKDESHPESSFHVLPIVEIWLSQTYGGQKWGVWSMLLKRDHTLGKAFYRRAGTAYHISRVAFGSLLPQLQEGLSEDDYVDMDVDGTCTVIVV